MGSPAATDAVKHVKRTYQTQYLQALLKRQSLSARDVARQSRVIAEELGDPKLAFGHSSVCYWLEGERNPSLEHRRILAQILGATLDEMNQGCDGNGHHVEGLRLDWVTVCVYHDDRQFGYRLALKSGLDLSMPAIHQEWTAMFRSWAVMTRHFRDVKHESYGWIPDGSAGQHRARCLVPLQNDTLILDSITSTQDRIWFMYLPGGRLECGIAFREKRSLALLKHGSPAGIQKFPLSRVDLIGFVVGEMLFRILPPPISIADGMATQTNAGASLIRRP